MAPLIFATRHGILIGCFVLACSDAAGESTFTGFDDEVVFESDHIRFHAHRSDADACAEAAQELERHFVAVSSYLELEPPLGTKIDYYKFHSTEELQDMGACNIAGSPACVHDGQVMSPRLFDAHELVHAYVEGTRPPWIFVEGLADALSCGYGSWSRLRRYATFELVSALTWRDLASWVPSGKTSDLTYYRAGAHLVRYLVERFGVKRLMQHYRSALSSTVPEEVDSDFSDSFGISMVDAWAGALDLDLPGGPCLTPFECSHEALALGDTWQVRGACGVGYAYRTLQLTVDTSLLLSTTGDVSDRRGERDSSDMLVACDGMHAFPTWTSSPEPPSLATRLDAGTYALILPLPAAEEAATLTTTPAGLVADCNASADLTLPIGRPTVQVAVPISGETWYARLAAEDNPSVEVFSIDQVRAPSRLCASCDADSPCTDVTAEAKETDIATMPVLEVDTESPRGGFKLLRVQPR